MFWFAETALQTLYLRMWLTVFAWKRNLINLLFTLWHATVICICKGSKKHMTQHCTLKQQQLSPSLGSKSGVRLRSKFAVCLELLPIDQSHRIERNRNVVSDYHCGMLFLRCLSVEDVSAVLQHVLFVWMNSLHSVFAFSRVWSSFMQPASGWSTQNLNWVFVFLELMVGKTSA